MRFIGYLGKYIAKRSTVEYLTAKLQETSHITRLSTRSKSEYFQDLWVIASLNQKTKGFFVEFGATDGISGSNTWLLENAFEWTGICAEPAQIYKDKLTRNRSCKLDYRVVWNKSGEQITFSEKEEGYLSSVASIPQSVAVNAEYIVESVTLNDLLLQHGAPKNIDYISIDVEGSELKILQEFFSRSEFDVTLFSIEHNWRDDKKELIELMQVNGYQHEYQYLSYRDLYFSRTRNNVNS